MVDVGEAQSSAEQAQIDSTNEQYNYLVQAASLECAAGLIVQGGFAQ
jgi:hypothetical protein